MSSANQDKALQVRPPIAVYTFEVDGTCQVFYIPGVPNWIMGQAPGGAHTMITNFLTLQAEGGSVYVKFFGRASPPGPSIAGGAGFVESTGISGTPTAPGPNPSPDAGGGILVGEVPLRFDLSDLQAKQTGDVVTPIQYMSYTGVDGAILRVWRSSGR